LENSGPSTASPVANQIQQLPGGGHGFVEEYGATVPAPAFRVSAVAFLVGLLDNVTVVAVKPVTVVLLGIALAVSSIAPPRTIPAVEATVTVAVVVLSVAVPVHTAGGPVVAK
jgi:hypothetical protein